MDNNLIPKTTLNAKENNAPERKKQEAVVKTPTQVKKKTMLEKIKEEFISNDGQSIAEYIILDVLVPAAKQTFKSMVDNGLDMLLFKNSPRVNTSLPANRVSYRSYYDAARSNNYVGYSNSSYARPKVAGYGYDEVVFGNRGDAEAVLYRMSEILEEYPRVTVADYLELSGRSSNYTDNNYGWTNLNTAQIIRLTNGGYCIDLPRPMALD